MNTLFVVSQLRDWPFDLPGVNVVSARKYLMDPAHGDSHSTRVINLCRSCNYQSRGYYVSLLADARGHQPLPQVKAIEDLQSSDLLQLLAENLSAQIQRGLRHCEADVVSFDVYFGQTAQPAFSELAAALFALLPVPLLHAQFQRTDNRWHLQSVQAISAAELTQQVRPLVMQSAQRYLDSDHQPHTAYAQNDAPVSIAILLDPASNDRPSNPQAIDNFIAAADALQMRAEIISPQQSDRIDDFDALFIRDTTIINHYTYHLARRAAAHGLVVIDDADSILRCNNKVYLTELLSRHAIPIPKTLMVHRDNIDQIIPSLGLPCILKQPDGAFSYGIKKIEEEDELEDGVAELLQKSEIILAQEFLPTEFDWRIGILDRRPLFACKYFMAPGHWQIIDHQTEGQTAEGHTQAFAIGEVPDHVLTTALKAANLIGDGFYGVDMKEIGKQCYVIEINDNPNVDAGNEDGVLHEALYREVMAVFRKRVNAHRPSTNTPIEEADSALSNLRTPLKPPVRLVSAMARDRG